MLRQRQHQLAIVEVGQDVGGDDEVEGHAGAVEALGHDVEGLGVESAAAAAGPTRTVGAGAR